MRAPRVLALCVFPFDNQVLAAEGHDSVKDESFYRPFGGGVEFGELAEDTVRREIREELGEELRDLRLLGVLENLYQFEGKKGHEIVFVFQARFVNEAVYGRPVSRHARKPLIFLTRLLTLESIENAVALLPFR